MIALRSLSLSRGGRVLFSAADLEFHSGQKIGIVGANGCGKSSFFSLLRGELLPDAGEVEIPPRAVVSHVEQEVEAISRQAIEYVIDGDAELRAVEREIEDSSGEKLAAAHVRMEEIGGYAAFSRAASLMHGLGFSDHEFRQAVAAFSGGWRMRLNLARALMCRSDILLLDEPTNHLDLDAVCWLEDWLKGYRGTLLFISHDRDFLDNVATHVCQLQAEKFECFSGNYSDFERQRAARLANQQASYQKQQREIAHLASYIERFRAKATKARQAQSRIKALARMEVIAAAHVDMPFSFSFSDPLPASDPLLRLEKAGASYSGKQVLQGVNLTISSGDRIALVGRNGAGKSTLVKMIAGTLAEISGQRVEGRGLKIGYFSQHRLESLCPDESPFEHLKRIANEAREQELRDYLGSFDFCGDKAFASVSSFSGGEKARLALALIIRGRPNLLLLDEPTNHLDLEMRHALDLALQGYPGALVLVSHDRHLIRSSADRLFLVENGKVEEYEGDLDGYRERLRAPREKKPVKMNERQLSAQLRNQRRPLESMMRAIEKEMNSLESEKAEIHRKLSDSALYSDKAGLSQALLRDAEIASRLSECEEKWFALDAELASVGGLDGLLEVQ